MKALYATLLFALAFIMFTVIGTLSHEGGHIAVAKYLGYRSTLHYASMHWESPFESERFQYLHEQNAEINGSVLTVAEQKEYELLCQKIGRDSRLIRWGGPIQTMLTGTLGIILLATRRKNIRQFGLKVFDGLAVFLSLFWLREIFNLAQSVAGKIFWSRENLFGGDEYYLSHAYGLWPGTFSVLFGLMGLGVAIWVLFFVLPKKWRMPFTVGGLIGGFTGFYFWMYSLGPVLLP